jgi:hypothetical protein
MKEFKIDFPQDEKEFDLMTAQQKDEVLEMMEQYKEKVSGFLQMLAEEAVYPIIKKNAKIEELVLDPNYQYNDEGYAPNFLMPFVNGNYDDYEGDYDMQKLDLACSRFAHLMTEDISVDVMEVKARYAAKKLDGELEKNSSKKRKNKV